MFTKPNYQSFKDLYLSAKAVYPSISDLDSDYIDNIEKEVEIKVLQADTKRYLIIISLALITVLFVIVLFFKANELSNYLLNYLKSNLHKYSKEYTTISTGIMLGFGFALITYDFVMPYFSGMISSTLTKINTKSVQFRIHRLFAIYLIIGLILYIWYLNLNWATSQLLVIIGIYCILPIIIGGTLSFMFTLVAITKPLHKSRKRYLSENKRLYLCFILLNVLVELKNYKTLHIINDKASKYIVGNLYTVSRIIETYSSSFLFPFLIHEPVLELNKASNSFKKIIVDFISSSDQQIEDFQEKIVNYLNIFLLNSLVNLPKTDLLIEFQEPNKKIRVRHFVVLILMIALPILIIIVLNNFFRIRFNDYTQSLLKILYIAWTTGCILSNPIVTNTENKEFIRDILKSLLGKG